MSDNIVSNYISNIISIYDKVISTYESNQEIIKQSEGERQDLLHEIRLSKPKNICGGYDVYKKLREVELRRGAAKDENEILQDFYEFCKKQVQTKKDMQKIQSNSNNVFTKLQSRQYHPRERNDLTITNKTAQTNKPFEDLLKDFKEKEQMKNKYKCY